jgi:hypothetical protein
LTTNISLPTDLTDFSLGKIDNIRNDLSSTRGSSPNDSDIFNADVKFEGTPLTIFSSVTTDEIRKFLTKAPVKSCELDPIPTHVLRPCLDTLIPIIKETVNKSLAESIVPEVFKNALVRPLLKKTNLDREELKNYHPVSNFPFLSKVTEKAVSSRIENHLNSCSLHDNLQSAYRSCHSTKPPYSVFITI